MTVGVFSLDERALLDAWFLSAAICKHLDGLLKTAGFERDCASYTRPDARVGAFAVADIQQRLPNMGISRGEQLALMRKPRKTRGR